MSVSHTRASEVSSSPYLILDDQDYRVLGPADFGSPGLQAIEVLGPYVDIQASGPLITIHDSTVDAGLGIGHHPHRYNERIFYIEQGELDHDDARNNIQGHMGTGDTGLFTEGRHGMVHSEWNHGEVPARAYILVYSTDPIPEKTAFAVLRDDEAPRYEEEDGVRTKEMVGRHSGLHVHGDIRLFTDSALRDGAQLVLTLGPGEGGLFSVREGCVHVDGREVGKGGTILLPPSETERTLRVRASGAARLLRVVHGPGHGFVRQSPGRQRRG